MVKPLIKLSYVGDGFHGYQAQRGVGVRTVQGEINRACLELFSFPCDVTGCSRTDAGVHALAYYAAITPSSDGDGELPEKRCSIPIERLPLALNAHLPDDIRVLSAREVDISFHPRYFVKRKTYIYKIYDSPIFDPFMRSRAMHHPRRFSDEAIAEMDSAAHRFTGKHDFRAFMAAGSSVTDCEREVYEASVARDGGCTVFRVTANGFLYNMVRIMAGTLIEVGDGRKTPDSVTETILSGERSRAGATAEASGLYLAEVEY